MYVYSFTRSGFLSERRLLIKLSSHSTVLLFVTAAFVQFAVEVYAGLLAVVALPILALGILAAVFGGKKRIAR